MNFDMLQVVAITVICYLVGMVAKAAPVDDKWIPCIVGALGGVLGVVGMYVMPDFPAHDVLNAVAIGIVSGLASTGAHQLGKQLRDAGDEAEEYEGKH